MGTFFADKSRIPFKLCVGFAIVLKRKERKRLEMETKEVDEETPLLMPIDRV